ncbi:PilZ domain-containing protein [Methylobacterium brachythecii]|uniref:PilZ domain-containing protein n=1 Tax=Methylobacterium brachythecii TaxID=1176177 RepID=A0A7W6F7X5_9HYPH|nr:PilZ domain-containing protein [Methylobacterium brachythecii]MBB3903892.1 hypothetical protein [Methylobacterium brachythecii]GLS42641.1 hypothetical protein GCM10007884_06260 [Methylobacterium brachythecii]
MRTIPLSPSSSAPPIAESAAERRGLDRKTVLIPAIAVCPDGIEYRCVLRDMSTTGARIGIPGRNRLPQRFKLVTGNRPSGFPMRLAWQRGDLAGLILEQDEAEPAPKAG